MLVNNRWLQTGIVLFGNYVDPPFGPFCVSREAMQRIAEAIALRQIASRNAAYQSFSEAPYFQVKFFFNLSLASANTSRWLGSMRSGS
jgi:hypothetical protein